jgi:uncharacterized membrane protein
MSIMVRGREISRLEALSDGVFAFAATLLVVSLEVPDTWQDLVRDLSGFGAFAISFAALMLIWTAHNGFFRRYGLTDATTTFLNCSLLLVVLFYVYPLKFVTRGIVQIVFRIDTGSSLSITPAELGNLFALYGAGFIAIFLCFALMYRHARAVAGSLGLSPAEAHEAAMWFRHYLIMAGVGALSVVMALAGVGIEIGAPGWIYVIIGPLAWAHGTWSEKAARRLDA